LKISPISTQISRKFRFGIPCAGPKHNPKNSLKKSQILAKGKKCWNSSFKALQINQNGY